MKRKDGISFISTEHKMATRQKRKREFRASEEWSKKKARAIIEKMTELNSMTREDTSQLVDEILHSIFFLGKIQDPSISPESILKDDDDDEDDEDENLFNILKSCYHQPFEQYSRQLPRRSPFSCVLDMMVKLVGQENEEEIRRRLQQFITDVEDDVTAEYLISNAICVSQNSNNSVRYYGVSMSTSGPNPGRIMVAASCLGLNAWDDYVAGAVMTYYPEEKEEEEEKKKKKKKEKKEKKEKSKKSYFDGTIKIPNYVRCQAFSLKNGGKINPCRSCSNLFGLKTDETKEWPYGNCAEAESLSNLLKNEKEVKKESQPTSDKWTPENIERAREEVLKELKRMLRMIKFKWDDRMMFYTPQKSTA